jgi:hypothetical protein
MGLRALLIEFLISGFFAVACFRARAEEIDLHKMTPRSVFGLTNRLERLRKTRWQWCSIVFLLVVMRMQMGTPMVAELTALIMFVLFLALPVVKPSRKGVLHRP